MDSVQLHIKYDDVNDVFTSKPNDVKNAHIIFEAVALKVYEIYKENEWKYTEDNYVEFRVDCVSELNRISDSILTVTIATTGNSILHTYMVSTLDLIPMMIWAIKMSIRYDGSQDSIEKYMYKIKDQLEHR